VSGPLRVVRSELLLRSHVFDVERRTVSDGEATFDREVVVHPGAVAVLAVDDEGRIGLLRQFRAPFDDVVLEIPAGTLDVADETPLEAARRELAEELGVTAAHWTLLGRYMVSPGWCTQVMNIFEARELTSVARHPTGPEERDALVLWRTPAQLRADLRAEPLWDYTLTVAFLRVYGHLLDE